MTEDACHFCGTITSASVFKCAKCLAQHHTCSECCDAGAAMGLQDRKEWRCSDCAPGMGTMIGLAR